MVWIPALKRQKLKDQPEDGRTASKPLCNIFFLLPGSAGGRGSAQPPKPPPPRGISHPRMEFARSLLRLRRPPKAADPGEVVGVGGVPSRWALLGQAEGPFQRGVPASVPSAVPRVPPRVRVLCPSHGDTPFRVTFPAGNPLGTRTPGQ